MSIELISALQNKSLYDHPVSQLDVIETHISWVILTGEYAYKIKKPVNFGFLDFSTLDKRHLFCQEEVRLNQRLAPSIYLEVVPISMHANTFKINDDSNIVEYAVKMRQFPQQNLLDALLKNQKLTVNHIDKLTDQIAEFHTNLTPCASNQSIGSAKKVFEPMQQNFEQIRPLLDSNEDKQHIEQLAQWTQSQFSRLENKLNQRVQEGHIKECHGDLHLGNIALVDEDIIIFDGIEFNDDFRWIDTINEIAFLIMDLEDRKRNDYANRLLNRYLQLTGDFDGIDLLVFYKVYRALVRAKIALFQRQQNADQPSEQEKLMAVFHNYINLALSYTQQDPAYLLVTHGVSGTGKTTISNLLVEKLGVIRLRSDVERKRLYKTNTLESRKLEINEGIYHPEATEKTYAQLVKLAKQLLDGGQHVVIDAACLLHSQRQLFQTLADETGCSIVFISCQAPTHLIEKRIQKRLAEKSDASEADLLVLAKQLSNQEPLTEYEKSETIFVNTREPADMQKLIHNIQSCLNKTAA